MHACLSSVSCWGLLVYASSSLVCWLWAVCCADRHYWTDSYTLSVSGETGRPTPAFLSDLANEIFVCGKSLNLLRCVSPQVSQWDLCVRQVSQAALMRLPSGEPTRSLCVESLSTCSAASPLRWANEIFVCDKSVNLLRCVSPQVSQWDLCVRQVCQPALMRLLSGEPMRSLCAASLSTCSDASPLRLSER